MRILTCFLPPTEGTASVAGYDVLDNPLEVKKRIGYLPETPPLYPEMEVLDYLRFVARLKGISRHEIGSRVNGVVERCAIGKVRQKLNGQLSKGYRQRVGLAQALIHNPDVLILDEPTAGLDPKQIIDVRRLIHELSGEHTIILSTHILPEVSTTCSRVIIINEGKLEASDTPENLTSRLQGHDTLAGGGRRARRRSGGKNWSRSRELLASLAPTGTGGECRGKSKRAKTPRSGYRWRAPWWNRDGACLS